MLSFLHAKNQTEEVAETSPVVLLQSLANMRGCYTRGGFCICNIHVLLALPQRFGTGDCNRSDRAE